MKSKIVKIHDALYFQVNDTPLDSLAFKSFRPTEKNVKDFYNAGVRLFHVYVSGLPSGLKTPYSLYGETWFGDHIYLSIGEGTYISKNFIGIYCPSHDKATISLIEDGEYEELFTGVIYLSNNKKIILDTSSNCAFMLMKIR